MICPIHAAWLGLCSLQAADRVFNDRRVDAENAAEAAAQLTCSAHNTATAAADVRFGGSGLGLTAARPVVPTSCRFEV